MRDLIEKFMDQEQLHSIEGRRGVIALARLARVLGYQDPTYFGQLDFKCSIGDLIAFLEDNSGAIEAIIAWIGKQRNAEWQRDLISHLDVQLEDDEEER
jgi:hypothetical protein